MKYLKVMYGTQSGANKSLEYKIGEVNITNNWNPNTENPEEFGCFNFSEEIKILKSLFAGVTQFFTYLSIKCY